MPFPRKKNKKNKNKNSPLIYKFKLLLDVLEACVVLELQCNENNKLKLEK